MRLRSLLFVPGDRPEFVRKAQVSGADAIILDLEDSVALPAKQMARLEVLQILQGPRMTPVLVRINALSTPLAASDIEAVTPGRPDGIVLPKAEGSRSVDALDHLLEIGERACGIPIGKIAILPIVTETPAALFKLGEYGGSRLVGLSWGAEDLSAAVGARTARLDNGGYTPPFECVRSMALFAAAAAGVAAIETIYPKFTDSEGLSAYATRGARDGFSGMLAIHPAQIGAINAAFTPTPDEITRARTVVAAFAAHPGAGVVALDGAMLDAPHLAHAKRVLARCVDQD